MGEKKKKQKGEKYDAYLVKDIDPIQYFMTSLLGTRTENEAVCQFDVEMSALNEYIQKKNSQNPEFKYTFFHVFCAAMGRTIAERPRMNYFIRNGRFYERKEISMAAIAKKQKKDGAEEGMIMMRYHKDSDESPVDQMHNSICKQVYHIRKDEESHDDTTKIMQTLVNLPRFIYKLVVKFILNSDRHGKLPKDLVDANPYSKTCFISNLGSIGITGGSPHHHLYEWGTTSLFITLGAMERKREFDDDGKAISSREYVQIGATVDERITSGFYFIKSLKLLQDLMNNPQELEKVPEIPRDTITKKEYKTKLREAEKQRKLAKKQAKKKS